MTLSKKKLKKQIRARWQLYLMLLVPVVVTFIFSYLPMGGLVMAFQKYNARDGIFGSQFVGLYQFDKFFHSVNFTKLLKNTLTLSLYSLIAGFPMPVILALLLNAVRAKKYKKVIQTVTYLPHFISTVVMVGLLTQLLNNRIGLYGSVYKLFTNEIAPNLFGNGANFKHLYVWSGVWQNMGYSSVIYFAALSGVDPTYHEAATLDGATRLQRVRHVDLPAILPTVSINLILQVGRLMSVGYEKVFLMQNNLNASYSEVISTYVYKIGLAAGITDFSYSTAIGMFNSVINFILLIVANKASKKLSGTAIF